MTTRYFTYTNDQSVSPRWIFNFSVGNSFGKVGLLSDVSLNFNIYNIFDEKYISTMGTGGFTASGDNQTLQVGAPRQLFITLKVSL
jgi:iron complex outermembrane receptor protein